MHPFRKPVDEKQVRNLCNTLINQRRGEMLGDEVLRQLPDGALSDKTFARLCRWVHPRRPEPKAQPVAEQISRILFGRTYPRED